MGRSLEGRVALVTGASQGGTGTAIATRFAAEGAKVAITARSEDGLRATLAAIEDLGGTGLVLPADLADPDGRRTHLVAETEAALGPIDILVNNAMAPIFKPVEEWTLADLDAIHQVNVWAPWLLMAEVLPGMRLRGRGWILNLTSSAAEFPPGPPFGGLAKAGYAGYASTKAALSRLTLAAAAETEGQGIAVNALTPQAAVATPAIVGSGYVKTLVGSDDVDWMFEPLDAMAEAALALCSGDPDVLTGRIAYSLQLLVELDRPVFDLRGEQLVAGVQPTELESKIRRQIEFHRTSGGPGLDTFDRPSTPWPDALGELTIDEFTDDVALEAGRWDRRFARVLAKLVFGDRAIALVDSNGARGGRVYENVDHYRWDPDDGWLNTVSGSAGSAGWADGIVYATGDGAPGAVVRVNFQGEQQRVEVQPSGHWLFAAVSDDPEPYPTVIEA